MLKRLTFVCIFSLVSGTIDSEQVDVADRQCGSLTDDFGIFSLCEIIRKIWVRSAKPTIYDSFIIIIVAIVVRKRMLHC
jgi:hypothetical protein